MQGDGHRTSYGAAMKRLHKMRCAGPGPQASAERLRGAQVTLSVRSPVNVIPRDILGIPILSIGRFTAAGVIFEEGSEEAEAIAQSIASTLSSRVQPSVDVTRAQPGRS